MISLCIVCFIVSFTISYFNGEIPMETEFSYGDEVSSENGGQNIFYISV